MYASVTRGRQTASSGRPIRGAASVLTLLVPDGAVSAAEDERQARAAPRAACRSKSDDRVTGQPRAATPTGAVPLWSRNLRPRPRLRLTPHDRADAIAIGRPNAHGS